MKTLSDTFQLTPEILHGMDGESSIKANVELFNSHNPVCEVPSAGDGVDFCIYAAVSQAERQQEPASDVLHHLRYQRDQLSILIRNLELLPE